MPKRRGWHIILSVAGLCVALLPWFTDSQYALRLATVVFFWVGMAGCWNIVSGYSGYIDFGPVAYFGIGAYTTGIAMTTYKAAFGPSVILSGVIAGIIAVAIGSATLRLKGPYFAIATFAFAETMKQVVLTFDATFHVSFFHGSHGISLPISGQGNTFFFYCVFVVTFVVLAVQYHIEHSPFGYGLKAIHEAETTAELVGVNTTAIKLRAYVTSASFLGILGGIQAYWITYIDPQDVFSVHYTVQTVIMTLLGGMGTFFGPVVGALFLTMLSEIFGTAFVEYYLIIIGCVIICVILLLPRGIVGTILHRQGLEPR